MDKSTIEILSRIDKTVAVIAKTLAPQNKEADTVSKLSKGDTSSVDAGKKDQNMNISVKSVADLVKVLGTMSPAIKAIIKLDGKGIESYKHVITAVINSFELLAECTKKNEDALKGASGMIETLNLLSKAMFKMPLLIIIAPLALLGITMTLPVIFVFGKMLQILAKMDVGEKGRETLKALTDAVEPIIKFTLGATLVVAACIGLGLLVKNGGTELILYGLGVLGATLAALTVMILLVGLASNVIKATKAFDGMKEIILLTGASFLLVAACVGLGMLLSKGDVQKLLMNGLIVLGATLLALLGIFLIIGLGSRLMKDLNVLSGVKEIIILTLASIGILLISHFLAKFVTEHEETIMTGLKWTAGVMLGLVGIGVLAGTLLKSTKQGIASLAVMELLAFGAMGLMLAASKLSEEIEGKAEAITLTVLGCMGIVTAFGLLAGAASFIAPEIIAGSIALGAVELFALGTIGLMHAILDFHKTKEESGAGWDKIGNDVIGMEAVMGSFGILAAAFGLLAVPIGLAMPGMYAVTKFAKACIGICNDVVNLHNRIEKAGGVDVLKNTVGKDMSSILKQFNTDNFKIDMSLIDIGKLIIKFEALRKLTNSFASVTKSLSSVANVAGMITPDGKIAPVLFVDKKTGEIRYGEPVDLVNVANIISSTVKTFVDNCNYGFEDVKKIFNAAAIFTILGEITNPISTFVHMLTGFVGGTDVNGNNTLAPVTIKDDGTIVIGQAVDVALVATTIANTVSSFMNELYKEENTGKWVEMMHGGASFWDNLTNGGKNKKTQAIEQAAGILGLLVTPVSDFVELLTKVSSTDGKTLNSIMVDNEGNIKTGQTVDVVKTSTAIASAITTFMSSMYGKSNTDSWSKMAKGGSESFDAIINPINKFTDILKAMSDDKKINPKNITTVCGTIDKMMATTIGKNMKQMNPVIDKFNKSMLKTASCIKTIDSVLNKDKDKRKKNIKELEDSISNLMEKFSSADNSINKLYNLVMALQTMDANKVSSTLASLNINTGKGGGSSNTQVVKARPSITVDDIVDAIKMALDDAKFNGTSIDVSGNPISNTEFKLDL